MTEAYQEVLDAAYAKEQVLTNEEGQAPGVEVSSELARGGSGAGGGGYGMASVGAATESSTHTRGPRLCMVMYG